MMKKLLNSQIGTYFMFLLPALCSMLFAGCGAGEPLPTQTEAGKPLPAEGEMPVLSLDLSDMAETAPADSAAAAETAEETETEETLGNASGYRLVYNGEDSGRFVAFHARDCQYNEGGILLYSHYITTNEYELSDIPIPYESYVLYLKTPEKELEIFSVMAYFLDEETKTLYVAQEQEKEKRTAEDGPNRKRENTALSLGKVSLQADDPEVAELSGFTLEEELAEGYQIADEEAWFAECGFEIKGTEQRNGTTFVKGEASGVWELSGRKYYLDFVLNEDSLEQTISPCVLRIYDKEKDAAEFERCREAFDKVETGDFSEVKLSAYLPWSSYLGMLDTSLEYPFAEYDNWVTEEEEWRREDVNRDGMPELILLGGNGDRTEDKIPITMIFAWQDGGVVLVNLDYDDAGEFLYFTEDGELAYETDVMAYYSSFQKGYLSERGELITEEAVQININHPQAGRVEVSYEYYRLKTKEELAEEVEKGTPESWWVRETISQWNFQHTYEDMVGREFLEDNSGYWQRWFDAAVTKEKVYDYEVITAEDGSRYIRLLGIREECRDNLMERLEWLNINHWHFVPRRLEEYPVREIAENAFRNINLEEIGRYGYVSIVIPDTVTTLGDGCFENCGIACVEFEKEEGKKSVSHPVSIGNRAFAGNPDLWGVLLNTEETSLGAGVFEGCTKNPYLCCIFETDENKERVAREAQENNAEMVEIPAYYSDSPMVEYSEEPLILTPEIGNFFYGDHAYGEFFEEYYLEYDDNATDFGFPELHLFCGEVCGLAGETNITASSTLPSASGRYEAWHILSPDRTIAWAEGAEGYGIGETISITDRIDGYFEKEWYEEGYVELLEGDMEPDIYDGYSRYIQVCIANGYGKNEKVFEENGRVKRMLMYVEDKPYAYLELEDTIYPQYFNLPADGIKAAFGVETDFRFEIQEVYPGTKYEDTCLTGILLEFTGRHGH